MTPDPQSIDVLLQRAEGNPLAMFRVAGLLRKAGDEPRAAALCDTLLESEALDPQLAAEVRKFRNYGVPEWHFSIVRDQVRNDAYDAALRRLVRPGMRVLEIGTGTGILAMMAARAGASVVTCEMNPAVAAAASEIVNRNGLGDRVTVIHSHSDTLDLDRHMGGRRADLLVSEIISNNMVDQGVMPAHARAARDLLVPGAPVIPARGRVRVALVEDVRPGTQPLGVIDGFDLSPFNRLAPSVRLTRDGRGLELRSEAADLFDFDFSGVPLESVRSSVACVSAGGPVNGVVQWIQLDMDGDGSMYENEPGKSASCWSPLVYPFDRTVETRAGDVLTVHGAHDGRALSIRCDSPFGEKPQ
jgi:type II protein arginine methyltransferase